MCVISTMDKLNWTPMRVPIVSNGERQIVPTLGSGTYSH
jgi:hypothetical protein